MRGTDALRRRVSPSIILWIGLGALLLLVGNFANLSPATLLFCASLLGGTQALGAFWRHGADYVSAPGVFMLGVATFAHFPGVYISLLGADFATVHDIATAVIIIYFSQILMYYLSWAPLEARRADLPSLSMAPRVRSWSFTVGVSLIITGFVLQQAFGLGSSSLAGAAAFTGAVLVIVSIVQARDRLRPSRLFLAMAAFTLYVVTMFSGGGRLVLGGLAVAVVIAVGRRQIGRGVKIGVLLGLPIGLVALASNRSRDVALLRGAQETGFESVVWPLERFAQLVSLSSKGLLDYGFGSSFYSTAVVFVPRSIWPEKPVGLGAELATLFRPELVGIGHSEAALVYGEWVYNFGPWGLALALPVTAWFVNAIDRALTASQRLDMSDRRRLIGRVATILAAAGLLDLVWVGSFMYMSRTGQRLLVLLLLYLLFAWHARERPARGRTST